MPDQRLWLEPKRYIHSTEMLLTPKRECRLVDHVAWLTHHKDTITLVLVYTTELKRCSDQKCRVWASSYTNLLPVVTKLAIPFSLNKLTNS